MLVRILNIVGILLLLTTVGFGQSQDTTKRTEKTVVKNDSTATDQAQTGKANESNDKNAEEGFVDKIILL